MDEYPYGFRVRRVTEAWDNTVNPIVRVPVDPPRWEVHLPHSCDEWSITGGYSGTSQEEAIADLKRFIAEAGQALAALRAGEEHGDPEYGE